MNAELVKQIEDKTLDCLLTLQDKLKITLSIPVIEFKQIGRKAGYAYYNENKLVLNPDFFNNGHADEMINDTLPHEIAHLVAVKKFGECGKGHGPNWKYVMRLLGLTPKRCHNYDLEGVKVRRRSESNFVYKCSCRDKIFLTQIRHNRHQSGRPYHCLMCKTELKFIGWRYEQKA